MNDVVFLVDTDAAPRGALSRRLDALGYTVEAFESADQLLRRAAPCPDPCCVVVDVDLQAQLAAADVPTSVAATKAGAVDLLTKPVDEADLLDAIQRALARGEIRVRADRLTPREREVFARVASCMLHRARVMRKLEAGSLAELVRMADRIGVGTARG
jgi:FixJ family two-component response regulator